MKIAIKQNLSLKPILAAIIKLRGMLVVLAVIAVLGATGLFLTNLFYAPVDPTYREQKLSELSKQTIKFNAKTLDALSGLQDQASPPLPSSSGRTDPFAPY